MKLSYETYNAVTWITCLYNAAASCHISENRLILRYLAASMIGTRLAENAAALPFAI